MPYLVQEGIWSPRDAAYGWRTVGEFDTRMEAIRLATGYPAARVVFIRIIFERAPQLEGGNDAPL